MTFTPAIDPDIEYPDSDGKSMADNTEQYEWIVKIKENLEILFANSPNVLLLEICSGILSKIRKLLDQLLPMLW